MTLSNWEKFCVDIETKVAQKDAEKSAAIDKYKRDQKIDAILEDLEIFESDDYYDEDKDDAVINYPVVDRPKSEFSNYLAEIRDRAKNNDSMESSFTGFFKGLK